MNIEKVLEQTAELVQSNTQNTALILNKISTQDRLINGLSKSVANISDTVLSLSDDINQLKYNEEITTFQNESLTSAAQKRICEILGNSTEERAKYFRTFIRKLYSDMRKNAGLGSKISRTPKRNYDRCMDYIYAWYPDVKELKSRADSAALARTTAKEKGYEC